MAEDRRLIHLNHIEHAVAIGKACGVIHNPLCDVVLSRTSSNSELLGGVIFQQFTGASILIHTAGLRHGWLTKGFMGLVFDYAFNQLGVGAVFSHVPGDNTAALEFNRKIGFKVVARIDDVYPQGQCVVHKITRSECRWLGMK
jgi:hypothetical protein